MPNFLRKPYKYACAGLGLRHPPDLLPDGLYPILHNMIVNQLGILQPRAGLSAPLVTLPSPVHSIRRLNDPTNSSFMRLIGAGTAIYDTTSATAIDTGYSGNPLSMVPFRPNQTPRPWMYLTDGTRSRKVRTDRTNFSQGTPPPVSAPLFARGTPNYVIVEQFNAVGSWTPTGTAGAITTPARFNTTMAAIVYDSGTTGWCSIQPFVGTAAFQPGSLVIIDAGGINEVVKIRQVFEAIINTTIASIQYDSGTTGPCSIVLTGESTGLQQDSLVQFGSPLEYVRVLSTSAGIDGRVSFRCSTTNTRAAGDNANGIPSFRTYTVNTFTGSETLTGNSFQSTISTGIGYLSLDDSGSPRHLSIINNRPVRQEDYLHISLQVDDPTKLTNLRIIINTDPVFPSDFTKLKNALYYDIAPSIFQSVIANSSSAFNAQQTALQIDAILNAASSANADNVPSQSSGIDTTITSTPVSAQTVPGTSVWTEILIPLSAMSFAGSSQVNGLSTVTGLIVQATVTGSMVLNVSSWWIGGTYGPDSTSSVPYQIFQRYRSSDTGTRSNPSPELRYTIDLQREEGIITPVVSTDPQIDVIDLFSIGGTLAASTNGQPAQPRLIATVPNTATPFAYIAQDIAVAVNETLEFNFFQPFPVSDLPKIGTCNVSGTSVMWVSGDQFNTSWQTGSEVIINNSVYTLYTNPPSATRLELIENAGVITGANFLIPEATLGGVPLSVMWGSDPITGVMFAVAGDDGFLYWTNPYDPDTASDANVLEVTSPSEPLLAGFMYNGRCYAYSTERLFNCYPNYSTNPTTGVQTLTYIAQEVTNAKGLFAPFAYGIGDNFWAVTRNGITAQGDSGLLVEGGLQYITDQSLYPLFPHKGQVGVKTNGYFPIDFSKPLAMRLCYTRSGLYFVYQDTNGTHQTMLYDFSLPTPGWFPLTYAAESRVFYEEEGDGLDTILVGEANGGVYFVGQGESDNGSPITFDFYSPSFDLGDSRLQKLFLDYMLDADLQGVSVTCTPYVNKLQTALAATSLSWTGRQQTPVDIIQPLLALYQDFSLRIQGSSTTATPVFYEFQPNAVMQPYLTVNLNSPNYISHGFTTYGHLRDGYFVYISTANINFSITTDLGLNYTFVLPPSGGKIAKLYVPLKPLKGLLFDYSATSPVPFAIFTDETIIHAKEWGSTGPFQPIKPFAGQSA